MLLVRSGKITKIIHYIYPILSSFPLITSIKYLKSNITEKLIQNDDNYDQCGTEYSNWVLARSAKFNHQVSFLKRKYGKDRYNIHKLTNMDYMCSMVGRQDKYFLNLNEKIVLLAQMNHVCNVLKKDKGVYNQFGKLLDKIIQGMANPEDYICVGTLMNVMVDLGELYQPFWVSIMDALFVRKYDEEFDELFGVYTGLYKYKKSIEEFNDYFEIQRNKIIFNIPIVYRNSLQTMRQYIKFNTYNLKQCRLLLKSLHNCKINQKYFWKSVNDWFSIFIREQLQSKQFQQFFIVAQNSIQKVLFDDGMIRPRSILQQVSQIAFLLSQHGFISSRYFGFVQNLIIYSIENGSKLYIKYLQIEKEQTLKTKNEASINQHMRIFKDHQKAELKSMQANYKTIFVNPTQVGSQSVIHCLIVIKRYYSNKPQETQEQKRKQSIDNRVISWLIMKLCQPKMKYTINELLMMIECREILSAMKVDVRSLVLEKVKDVRQKDCSLNDLKDILLFLPLLQFQSVSYILEHFLSKAHPKDILDLTRLFQRESLTLQDFQQQIFINKQLEINPAQTTEQLNPREQVDRSHLLGKQKDKRWMPYLANYFLKLPGSVNYHQNYFSFQQNCYFLYLLLKNEQYWQNKIDYNYLGEMEKLKHAIKIASYSRGFKLQMGTYFYKLMNYIDLVAFFDGG